VVKTNSGAAVTTCTSCPAPTRCRTTCEPKIDQHTEQGIGTGQWRGGGAADLEGAGCVAEAVAEAPNPSAGKKYTWSGMRREERMASAGRFPIGRRSRWPWVGDEKRGEDGERGEVPDRAPEQVAVGRG
jgi:hypothetical protein